MPTRLIRFFVVFLCLALCGQQSAIAATDDSTLIAPNPIHTQLTKRGIGHQVKLIRADGSEIKGRIVNINETSVDLQPKGATTASTVSYEQIAQVKGPGLSTGAKVGIGVGIGVVAVVGVLAIVVNHELSKPW